MLVIIKHADDLIAGPLRFPYFSKDRSTADNKIPENQQNMTFLHFRAMDSVFDTPNPVAELLRTSCLIRELTLKNVSAILGIPLVEGEKGRRCVSR